MTSLHRVSEDMVNMVLKQKGASSIKSLPSYVNIVKFEEDCGIKLTYVYQINEGEGIYLQRMAPYPMRIGMIYNEQDLIDFITRDVHRFRCAHDSSNFSKFIRLTNELATLDRRIENVFMMRNVSGEDLDKVEKAFFYLDELISDIEQKSPLLDEPK